MIDKFEYLSLVQKKNRHRAGTAVLIFPGLVPKYSDLARETKLLAKFGDVWVFRYPEDKFDIIEFYDDVTERVKRLHYKRIILMGVSFGGTLAYLLMRYWRKHRFHAGVRCFVSLSTPFEPENLTPISQFQLDIGMTLDRYARRVFIWVIMILRWFWSWPVGWMTVYARDNSFRQTLNAMWMGGATLGQDWIVKRRLTAPPALLLNVQDGMRDRIVGRTNEIDFKDIFPRGKVLRVLKTHADMDGMAPAAYRQVEEFIGNALER